MASAGAYRPMLATLATEVPTGPDWLFEVKWDGYRALAYVGHGEVRLVSRTGNDLTKRFPNVAGELARATKSPALVLDGEVCALDEQGRPSFSAMQQARPGTPIVYEVFDLLEVEGEVLVDRQLRDRRRRLQGLLDGRNRTVRLSETFEDGEALYRAAREQGLEGIVAKRADSPYRQGKRTRDWLKIKTHGRQEFVIVGYTRGQGRRAGRFGSLVLGVWRANELVYVGNCGTGFTDKDIDELLAKLRPLEQNGVRVRGRPEDAQGAEGGRGLGEAGARLRGRVRRMDARRAVARALLPGPAGGQAGAAGPPRGAAERRDQAGLTGAQALQSGQGLLARGRGSRRAICSPTTERSRRC